MDPAGVWFWTKPRVRMYLLFVAAVLLAGIAVSLLVLAGALADAAGLRGVLMAGLLLALVTLLVRIGSDIVGATRA
jgi:hypothetical protein